jgi:hypothetical protein
MVDFPAPESPVKPDDGAAVPISSRSPRRGDVAFAPEKPADGFEPTTC